MTDFNGKRNYDETALCLFDEAGEMDRGGRAINDRSVDNEAI